MTAVFFSSVCDSALFNWFALIVWCVEMIKSNQSDLTILFSLFSFIFYWGDVGGGVGDQCKRPIRPPPAHTTGMIHLARNRVNQTLLIISDYHYSFSLFLIIVIIINIISDSFKTGSIRSYWLFLPSHVLHFRKKNQ